MRTEIIFLLDRSGSMAGSEKDTIGGFNSFLQKQSEQGPTTNTAILFDHDYEVLWTGMDARDVRLTEHEYTVRGMTALLDAVGKAILDTDVRLKRSTRSPDHVLFVITTDGLENSSREFSYRQVKELIRGHGDWEFIFMGANIDVFREAGNLGISEDRAFSFEVSEEGIQHMYEDVSMVVSDLRKGRG